MKKVKAKYNVGDSILVLKNKSSNPDMENDLMLMHDFNMNKFHIITQRFILLCGTIRYRIGEYNFTVKEECLMSKPEYRCLTINGLM